MTDYISRQAAQNITTEWLSGYITDDQREVLEKVDAEIGELSAADVVEVVRCKDCIYQGKAFRKDKRMKEGGYYLYSCKRNGDPFTSHTVRGYDDEFCSYGERADK